MATTNSKLAITGKPVWFITGCSSGIGRELAKHVLECGYRAVVTARNLDDIADLAAYGDALALKLDVTDQGQIDAAIKETEKYFGHIDVLMNNAGICYFSSVEESEEDQVRAISGRQPGDPVRAAHVIVKATESLNPPHRLLLGNDAYEAATTKLEELRKEFSAMESVSRMADFPKDMQGQTAWTVSKSRR